MEKCRVTFIWDKQNIIIDFTEDEEGILNFKPSFDPKVDTKTNLGLAGFLCEKFLMSILPKEDSNNLDIESSKKVS